MASIPWGERPLLTRSAYFSTQLINPVLPLTFTFKTLQSLPKSGLNPSGLTLEPRYQLSEGARRADYLHSPRTAVVGQCHRHCLLYVSDNNHMGDPYIGLENWACKIPTDKSSSVRRSNFASQPARCNSAMVHQYL